MNNIYVIEAFRWGAINDHHFIVKALCNRIKSLKYAEWYHEHRDRKYGIVITRHDPKNNLPEIIKYIPSKCGEDEPYYNNFKEDLTSLGHDVLYLNEDSIKKLPHIIRKEVKRIKNKKYE